MTAETPRLIDTRAELLALGERLRGEKEIFLDTEFHGESRYFPELMLIQLATSSELVVIDPLSPELRSAIGMFFGILAKQGKTFSGHALSQDLGNLYRLGAALPTRVFDTQIAAAFLDLGDQIGLASLLELRLGVVIDKLYSRADWSQRPLPEPMLRYAVDDVRALPALARSLREELERRGRLAWVDAECASLTEPATHEPPDPERAWQNVARRPTEPRALANVQALAAARERIAQEQDRPPRQVLRDEILVDLARRSPTDLDGLDAGTQRQHAGGARAQGKRWLAALREAEKRPDPAPPEPKLTAAQEAVIALARTVVTLRLREASLSRALAPKDLDAALRRIVLAERPDIATELALTGWRAELLLEPLVSLLEGRSRLSVRRDEQRRAGVIVEG